MRRAAEDQPAAMGEPASGVVGAALRAEAVAGVTVGTPQRMRQTVSQDWERVGRP